MSTLAGRKPGKTTDMLRSAFDAAKVGRTTRIVCSDGPDVIVGPAPARDAASDEVRRLKNALGEIGALGDFCEECEISGAPPATHLTTQTLTGIPIFLCTDHAEQAREAHRKAESKGCGKQPEVVEHEQDTAVTLALAALDASSAPVGGNARVDLRTGIEKIIADHDATGEKLVGIGHLEDLLASAVPNAGAADALTPELFEGVADEVGIPRGAERASPNACAECGQPAEVRYCRPCGEKADKALDAASPIAGSARCTKSLGDATPHGVDPRCTRAEGHGGGHCWERAAPSPDAARDHMQRIADLANAAHAARRPPTPETVPRRQAVCGALDYDHDNPERPVPGLSAEREVARLSDVVILRNCEIAHLKADLGERPSADRPSAVPRMTRLDCVEAHLRSALEEIEEAKTSEVAPTTADDRNVRGHHTASDGPSSSPRAEAPKSPGLCVDCKQPLLPENAWMMNGCPCNVPAAVPNASPTRECLNGHTTFTYACTYCREGVGRDVQASPIASSDPLEARVKELEAAIGVMTRASSRSTWSARTSGRSTARPRAESGPDCRRRWGAPSSPSRGRRRSLRIGRPQPSSALPARVR